jgi:hypothetical protein
MTVALVQGCAGPDVALPGRSRTLLLSLDTPIDMGTATTNMGHRLLEITSFSPIMSREWSGGPQAWGFDSPFRVPGSASAYMVAQPHRAPRSWGGYPTSCRVGKSRTRWGVTRRPFPRNARRSAACLWANTSLGRGMCVCQSGLVARLAADAAILLRGHVPSIDLTTTSSPHQSNTRATTTHVAATIFAAPPEASARDPP